MLDSKSYRMGFENASLEELFSERDRIIEFMHKYENHELPNGSYAIDPNPEVVYFSYIGYLMEICSLIKIKMIDDDFYSKSYQIIVCRDIDEYFSSLDENQRKEELEMLKNDDKQFYDVYMKWKKNKE